MLSKDDFDAVVQRVTHHGTERHAQALYGLIKWLKPASVIEVGACHGFTTCWIARAIQENNREAGSDVRLVVIDDYSLQPNAYMAFWHNMGLCQVGDLIDVCTQNSRQAEWPDRIDFAYIDADHSLVGCKHDVDRAIERGAYCVALHDTATWWGPREYVEKHMPEGWTEISVGFDHGFTVMMKRPEKAAECVFSQVNYPEGHI